jgi:hypothetical protein
MRAPALCGASESPRHADSASRAGTGVWCPLELGIDSDSDKGTKPRPHRGAGDYRRATISVGVHAQHGARAASNGSEQSSRRSPDEGADDGSISQGIARRSRPWRILAALGGEAGADRRDGARQNLGMRCRRFLGRRFSAACGERATYEEEGRCQCRVASLHRALHGEGGRTWPSAMPKRSKHARPRSGSCDVDLALLYSASR